MVDYNSSTVCCMCGDVGFQDKLFRCMRCLSRFQHPYCSNYYSQEGDRTSASGVCDWCRSEERTAVRQQSKKKDMLPAYAAGERIKQTSERDDGSGGSSRSSSKSTHGQSASASSSKAGGRRYKLLKDVLC